MCKYIDGVGSIEHYFNSQRARPSFLLNENPTVGISNSVVSTDQGYLICSFSREKANPSIENYFDLNMDYYLLLAKASINGLNLFIFYINQPFLFLFYHFLGQTIAYHSTNRLFSSEKLNFVATSPQILVNKLFFQYNLVKLKGKTSGLKKNTHFF